MRLEKWDEADIASRGEATFDIARQIWQGPAS